jgi:hypothetical protein
MIGGARESDADQISRVRAPDAGRLGMAIGRCGAKLVRRA